MAETIVSTERLTKIFRVGFWARRVTAVEGLSLEVKRGEIFGLLGPNGAGKTTTIKVLLGFVKPTKGRATVCGAEAGSIAARRKLGYLPENPALYEFLRGDEFLVFAGRMAGLSAADARKRTEKLLETVGLAGRADRPIRRFSKGMVQRLALAQALIGDPEVVILDEPMSGLDPIGRKDVRDVILKLRNEGRTVLFSTHILSDVEAICDRVGLVVDGKLTDCGALHDLVAPGARAFELMLDGLGPTLPPELAQLVKDAQGQALHNDRSWVLTFADRRAGAGGAQDRAGRGRHARLLHSAPAHARGAVRFACAGERGLLVIELLAAAAPRLWLAYTFAVGAVVGSFLNVVIARVPAGESVVHPRSRCPRCKAPIAWFDNLPILSWLVLRATLPQLRAADQHPLSDRRSAGGRARARDRAASSARRSPRSDFSSAPPRWSRSPISISTPGCCRARSPSRCSARPPLAALESRARAAAPRIFPRAAARCLWPSSPAPAAPWPADFFSRRSPSSASGSAASGWAGAMSGCSRGSAPGLAFPRSCRS